MERYIEGSEANPDWLNGKTVAMLGYGNQGRPQARNLQDSGVKVVVGLYESSTKWQTAIDDGMEVVPTEVAAARGDFLMLCLPDTAMADIYSREIASHVQPGKTLAFCHGFNIRFGLLEPPPDVDVVLIGPKGTGPHLRREFESGRGVPSLVAVHQDASGHAMDIAMAYAWGIGSARSFLLETTFAEETESDLFGEQTILCGGVPELIKQGLDTLIRAGISPEVAYFECLSDAKLVLDLLYERGFSGMRNAISDTAEWGGLTEGPVVIDSSVAERMQGVLDRIQDGSFARKWMDETKQGMPRLKELRDAEAAIPIEKVSAEIRRRLKKDSGA